MTVGAYAGHTIAVRNDQRRRGVPQGKWYDILHRPDAGWSVRPVLGPDYRGVVVQARL